MSKLLKLTTYHLILTTFFLIGCSSAPATGSLEILANGEDFVRDGFVSVDGWQIDFDKLTVNVDSIEAFQTDPPYDASTGANPNDDATSVSSVAGDFMIDLTQDRESGEPIVVHTVADAAVGQFNAISWKMSSSGNSPTIQMIGTAQKDGETVNFDISVVSDFGYTCGEYVGDERKGFVEADNAGDIEMTFHLDHVFGDGDSPQDDPLNVGALGFQPLADLAQNGSLVIDSAELVTQLSSEDSAAFQDTLGTLGHVGEGHCYETTFGYTGDKK